jgi:hypothetical protein
MSKLKLRPDAPWYISSWRGEPLICQHLNIWLAKSREYDRIRGQRFTLPMFTAAQTQPIPKFRWICDYCGKDVGGPHTPTCPHCGGQRPLAWRRQVVK